MNVSGNFSYAYLYILAQISDKNDIKGKYIATVVVHVSIMHFTYFQSLAIDAIAPLKTIPISTNNSGMDKGAQDKFAAQSLSSPIYAAYSGCSYDADSIGRYECNAGFYDTSGAHDGVQYCAVGFGLPAAGVRILVLGAEYDSVLLHDVRSTLVVTGAFISVDIFDAAVGTPALSHLRRYDAVLVFSAHGFGSPSALGDVLADYWDGGGAVVLAEFALGAWAGSWPQVLQGRFGSASRGYLLINSTAGYESPPDSLGTVLEPQSPLVAGVGALGATLAYRSTGNVINGGVVVAAWAGGGQPLIVRGARAGRPLVAHNVFPVSSSAEAWGLTGDVGPLLRNALLYSTCKASLAGVSCAPCLTCDANAADSGCSAGAAAINTCTCNAGYYGNGLECAPCLTCDVNAADSGCSAGAAAINTCTCNAGYLGTGVVCVYAYNPAFLPFLLT